MCKYKVLSVFSAAKVYSQYQFQSLLDYHDLTALSCMSVPDSDVWKNTWEFNFSLSLRRLKFALMGEIGLAFSTGRRAWKEGNKYKVLCLLKAGIH